MKNVTVLPTPGTTNDPEWVEKGAYQNLVAALKNGAQVLQGIWAQRLQIEDLKADGFEHGQAHAMRRAAHVFFGPTRHKKLQRQNQQLAVQKQICVAALTGVAAELQHLHRETKNPVHQPQAVLKEILETATGWVADIRQHAVQIIKAHNRAIEEEHEKARRQAEKERERYLQKQREQQCKELKPVPADDKNPGLADQDFPETDKITGTGPGPVNSRELIVEGPPEIPSLVDPPSVPEPIQTPLGEVIFTSRANAAGQRTMIIHAPEAVLAAFEIHIDKQARALMRTNSDLNLQQARYVILENLQKQAAQNTTEPDAETSTCDAESDHGSEMSNETHSGAPSDTATGLEPEAYIFHGSDYKELKKENPSTAVLAKSFGSTYGRTRTGAELKKQGLGKKRTFIHLDWDSQTAGMHVTRPEQARDHSDVSLEKTLTRIRAPLDLGTNARAPNTMMRKIIDVLFLQCVWPGCPKPATLSQYHHIVAAKNGGPTSIWNLTKLCPHHNGRNDDDRDRPVNGYVFVEDGIVKFQPPNGREPVESADPLTQLGGLAISHSKDLPSLEEILDVPKLMSDVDPDSTTDRPTNGHGMISASEDPSAK